jgi:hypothetical protein
MLHFIRLLVLSGFCILFQCIFPNPFPAPETPPYYAPFRQGDGYVYDFTRVTVDSTGILDTETGILSVTVLGTDTVRSFPVSKWVSKTLYKTGKQYSHDTVFSATDYISETGYWMYKRAFSGDAESATLLKRSLRLPTDSVTSQGDTVSIENDWPVVFCKRPEIGDTFNLRWDWLFCRVTSKENVTYNSQSAEAYKISVSPRRFHPLYLDQIHYSHNSWINENGILKTEITYSPENDGNPGFRLRRYNLEMRSRTLGNTVPLDPRIP